MFSKVKGRLRKEKKNSLFTIIILLYYTIYIYWVWTVIILLLLLVMYNTQTSIIAKSTRCDNYENKINERPYNVVNDIVEYLRANDAIILLLGQSCSSGVVKICESPTRVCIRVNAAIMRKCSTDIVLYPLVLYGGERLSFCTTGKCHKGMRRAQDNTRRKIFVERENVRLENIKIVIRGIPRTCSRKLIFYQRHSQEWVFTWKTCASQVIRLFIAKGNNVKAFV